jgi:branched-chain amino acid transport system ATP-binding protein
MTAALELHGVCKSFGAFAAVQDVHLRLEPGERRALIGPNGAGKTTLFNLISGRLRPSGGQIVYGGRDITALSAPAICRLGMARTFQITSIYPKLTPLQNVQTAIVARRRRSYWLLRRAAPLDREEAAALLDATGLAPHDGAAGLLSYGDQKRLELAIVLALQPRLLLLDEPTAGVEVQTRHALVALIRSLCDARGLTVLFCEHDMDAVFSIADRITVLHQGRVLMEGTPDAIRADAAVRAVYLGGAAA